MRLDVTPRKKQPHRDIVNALCWSTSNQLYTCSDDAEGEGKACSIYEWNNDGELVGRVCETDAHVTDLAFIPPRGGAGGGAASSSSTSSGPTQGFVAACSDGTLHFYAKGGQRIEKKVEGAARGAVS